MFSFRKVFLESHHGRTAPALTDDDRDRPDLFPPQYGAVVRGFGDKYAIDDEPTDPDSYTLDTDKESYATDELELELTSDEKEEHNDFLPRPYFLRKIATLTPFSPLPEGQDSKDCTGARRTGAQR